MTVITKTYQRLRHSLQSGPGAGGALRSFFRSTPTFGRKFCNGEGIDLQICPLKTCRSFMAKALQSTFRLMSRWSTWNDWWTKSSFRVRISLDAAEKLRGLPERQQHKLKAMTEEVAQVAASAPAGLAHAWKASFNRPLLQLRFERITIGYAIDEDTRTISVEQAGPDQASPAGRTS